jgi:integrase/recombinase XerD
MSLVAPSQPLIDAFIDALWLEDGLSKNTLEAYRRDLHLYAQWLAPRVLTQTCEDDLSAYFSHRHEATKSTTANRRLTVFKRYFRWALREGVVLQDPTLKLHSAKQALRVPKTLTEAQVEALLAAPDTAEALGVRDRTMLQRAAGKRAGYAEGVSAGPERQRAAGFGQRLQRAFGAVW